MLERPGESAVVNDEAVEAAAALPPGVVMVTRRRTGAGEIFSLLGSYRTGPNAGAEPFFGGRPFDAVSKAYHDGRYWEMRKTLRQLLAPRPFFKHQYDVEPIDLNLALFEALAENGYRMLVVDREEEAERLFSIAICTHFNVWGRDGLDDLRRRVRNAEPLSAPSLRSIRQLVRSEQQRQEWFERTLARYPLPKMRISYEQTYRRGTAVLEQMDHLFDFAGLPPRAACVSDDSLLRFALLRGHYTLGLIQYSRALLEVYETIRSHLQESALEAANDDAPAPSPAGTPPPPNPSPET